MGDLTASADYPLNPSGVSFPTQFEGPLNWADNYGTRLRGYVHPPVSGTYTFWISGDDNSLLYLSQDDNPSSKAQIASVASWTASQEWNKEPNQQSAPIALEANKTYYIEALHKEGSGGDNIAVAWQLPNGTFEGPIPGQRLSPFLLSTNPPTITSQPLDLDLEEGQRAMFQVAATGADPLVFRWQRNGIDVFGENTPRLVIDPVSLSDDEATFRCVISNPLGTATSAEAHLRVRPESTPPVLLRTTPANGVTVRFFGAVELEFSEPVTGLTASDLLVNGQPASEVSGLGAGPYVFTFPPSSPGPLTFSWNPAHNIRDLSPIPNAFAGHSWSLQLDPAADVGPVILNEFLASNPGGLADEDGEFNDWIELHNPGTTPVNLEGWSLSEDPRHTGQWIFPARTLPAGGYLVVFASGKDRRPATPGAALHLNFKLSRSGEHLGLYSPEWPRQPVDVFAADYPVQRSGYSYGRASDTTWHYYATPTPGGTNVGPGLQGVTEAPRFSAQRGRYRDAFTLHLSCPTPGAALRYTTDGSEPTLTNGRLYTTPLQVTTTLTLRAAAFLAGQLPSEVVTHTYLVGRTALDRPLPILSIVTDTNHLFGPTGILDPANTPKHGIAWERPVSVEWIRPEDNGGFAAGAGLRVQGGAYVRDRYDPNGSLPYSKYSLRLYFRGDYGASTLRFPLFPDQPVDEFEKIVLRAGMNDHSNPFITDELIRRLHANMGHIASHGTFADLFINGVYKGYYNPTERIDANFLRSWTGSTQGWDVVAQNNEVVEGDLTEWNRLSNTLLGQDLSVPQNYAAAAQQLDIDSFIDYLLVNIYAATGDWPWNNWRAARERSPDARWRFIIWDAEWGLGLYNRPVTHNTLSEELTSNSPVANFFRALSLSPAFRTRFGDRFHHHFYNGGALTDERILAQYWELRNQMIASIPNMQTRIHTSWIPQRRAIIHQHLADAGLQASANAPRLNQHGGIVAPGFPLSLSAPSGTIYYTLDGTDPALPAQANTSTLTLLDDATLRHALIPAATDGGDQLGDAWQGGHEPFDSSTWLAGTRAIGFDRSPDYLPYIGIDLTPMFGQVNSAFLRIPFTVNAEDLVDLSELKLRVRYDDGFVAWLNGTQVASANAPSPLAWNSGATAGHPDNIATNWQPFDISSHLSQLRTGQNLLAFQALNAGLTSSDFLLAAELVASDRPTSEPSPSAIAYNAPFTLTEGGTIKARTLANGQWSALLEAPFTVNLPGLPLRITEIMYHPPGGDAYEFIELANLGPNPIDIGGFSLEGVSCIFPEGTVFPALSRLVIASVADLAEFQRRYPAVTVAATFGGTLANGGERLALLDRNQVVVHAVTYGDSAPWPQAADGSGASLELLDPYGDPNAPATWTASGQPGGSPGTETPPHPIPTVRLNEIMTDNLGSVALANTFPDWIELHNAGESPVNLTRWSLSDGGDPRRFVFPENTTLSSHAYLLVYCDTNAALPGLHTGFSLKRTGEDLALYDAQTNRVDAVSFGHQIGDLTLARSPSAPESWILGQPSPGAANLPASTGSPSQLRINEWLANSTPDQEDWLELHNTDVSRPVPLQGLHLVQGGAIFRLTSLQFIPAAGYLRLTADETVGPDHLEFRLPAQGSTLSLLDPAGQTLDRVTYSVQTEGVSEGRLPNGSGPLTRFPQTSSPGAANYLPSYDGPLLNEYLADNRGIVTNSLGRTPDWIELHNPTALSFDLTGYGIAIGDPDQPDWSFPAGTLLPAGAFLAVECDGNQPASTLSGSPLNLGRSLPREGSTLTLLNPAGQAVDQIRYGAQIPDASVGRTAAGWALLATPTPGAANSPSHPLGSPYDLRINEWMAAPTTGPSWFELYNSGASPVDLGGLYLSDDPSLAGLTNRYRISPLSFLAPHDWLLLQASGDPDRGGDHIGFQLSPWGDNLALAASASSVIDLISFGAQPPAVSSGRFPDGSASQSAFPASASPGEPNYLPLDKVVINEILAHTDPPLEDAIELLNLSGQTIDLSGYYLSDSARDLTKYRIPDNTLLAPGSFAVLYESALNGGTGSATPFTLNSYLGDTLYLSAADTSGAPTGYRTQVTFGPTANGVSLGRHVTSTGVDYAPQIRPTFGVDQPASLPEFRTGQGAPNAGPLVGPILLNEILANPPELGDLPDRHDAEFIELTNTGDAPIPLYDPDHPQNTWRLTGGIDYAFPTNLTLAPRAKLLVVGFDPLTEPATLQAFRHRYDLDSGATLIGPYSGRLADEGETVQIFKPDPPQTSGPEAGLVPYVLVEHVAYSATPPWPDNGIGSGASLHRTAPGGYANEPLHWTSGVPSPGTAAPQDLTDADHDGMPDPWEMDFALDPTTDTDAPTDADLDGLSNLAEYWSGTNPRDPASRLELSLALQPAGERTLSFRARAGITYAIDYRDSLTSGTWMPLLEIDAAWVGEDIRAADPIPAAPDRYYRLRVPNPSP